MIEGTCVVSSACRAHADALVQRRRQQMIDDVEALLAARDSRPRSTSVMLTKRQLGSSRRYVIDVDDLAGLDRR